jgi:Arc/MetJ family transcription regulator
MRVRAALSQLAIYLEGPCLPTDVLPKEAAREVGAPAAWIYRVHFVYTPRMAKHLIDLDEDALSRARAQLGTGTIKDTVNEALRLATGDHERRVAAALDVLARADRADAWR